MMWNLLVFYVYVVASMRVEQSDMEADKAQEEMFPHSDKMTPEKIQEELVDFLKEGLWIWIEEDQFFPKYQAPSKKTLDYIEGKSRKDPCQQQVGGLLVELTKACEQAKPWDDRNYFGSLPLKTCVDSAKDVFLHGKDIIAAMRVPSKLVQSKWNPVGRETLRLVQSLYFMKQWVVGLATTEKAAILWAGFWTDPDAPKGHLERSSKENLLKFARLTESQTVHPSTKLGQMIEKFDELDQCRDHPVVANFWSFASFSFVLGMRQKHQGTVIALVNKDLTGKWRLDQSVLSQHEIPTLGIAAWALGWWSPQIILLDLKGTCSKTSPILRKRMFSDLKPWFRVQKHFTPEEFAYRSRPTWTCIDCIEKSCSLSSVLAKNLKKLQEAQDQKDRKSMELLEAAAADHTYTGLRLLDSGADPNVGGFRGFTALHRASQNGNLALTRALLRKERGKGLRAAKTEGGMTPLMLAAGSPKAGPRVVRLLLQERADVHAKDWWARTALTYAEKWGRVPEVISVLKSSGRK